MEQTNFSIRKYFEELRAFTAFRDGLIKICLEDQETICKQVEAQEKKYKEEINVLRGSIEDFQANVREYNTKYTIAIIDVLQRAVGVLSEADAIERNRVIAKMMNYIRKL